ncbi:MAG: Histidinol-phosphate/aromatic aminotransferase [Chloroflexi bacterium]|jgi:histidinol-phosphate/aromatic aminotransferase/cobyric acid decarboxylase-like protein|nr:MAG: Histidinol-phosphate/aromatic aminotransferase [Chloroflexota bacterium]
MVINARRDPLARRATTAGPSHPESRVVQRAILLAAGKGTRLQPLTADLPKCLVEVDGKPLLMRALDALALEGVKEAVIVVGYGGDTIREQVGPSHAGLTIRYVDAPDFATTNNIRSLWDARRYLDQDIFLLEADVAFDPGVLAALQAVPGSSAAVAPYRRPLSGTVVHRDGNAQVTSFTLGAGQGPGFDTATAFKTVNIYLLREALLGTVVSPRLCCAVEAGHVDRYYETVLQEAVAEGALSDLTAVDVSAHRWYEIDDHRDLDAAAFLFLNREAQYDRIQQLHGSYWRYGFTDHSYLYNMYFPPPAMMDVFHDDLHEIVTNYPVGQQELARLVADWTGADPDRLAVANGAAELIKILGNQFMRRMTIPTPSFNEYEAVIAADGLNRFALDPVTFELDVEAFAESAIAWGSDTAIVVTPNNPTALSVSRDDILRLARRLGTHSCRLIVDESFIEFADAGEAGSVEDVIETYPNLVVIKSLSKVFGIAGLRIGYLLSSDQAFIDAVRGCLPIWNVNGLAEEFLRTVGRYRSDFAASCERMRADCQGLYADLLRLTGVEPIEPDANFILARLGDGCATAPQVARRLYVEHNILVKDCASKSMPDAERYLRIASRTPAENRVLVEALAEVLDREPTLTREVALEGSRA